MDAAHGDMELVKRMLLDKPLLLNMPNGNETALGAACQMKNIELIQFLLAQGATMDISTACVLGLTDKVAEFLDADPSLLTAKNWRSHGKTPIVFASEQPDVLELLKSRGSK